MPQFLELSGPLYKYNLTTIIDILNIHLRAVIDKDITISNPEIAIIEGLAAADISIPPFRLYKGTLLHNKKRLNIQILRLKVLYVLASAPFSLITSDTIQRLVWPDHIETKAYYSVKKTISLLRADLRPYVDSDYFITTIRGVGYMLMPANEETVSNGARAKDSLSKLSPM